MGLSLDGRDTLLIPSILIRLFVDVEHIKAAATAFPGRPDTDSPSIPVNYMTRISIKLAHTAETVPLLIAICRPKSES
ncbi:hypothetical protein AFLA_010181 [Aspergillus flavus NRRL3357]|nr:hypothetical protein AFLA_010181 [Aspergillus flavus NRRL3357]